MKFKFSIRRTKRSELLIGVMIGIYGNWLISGLEKVGTGYTAQTGLFGLSFFPLLLYFMEAFSDFEEQTWIGKIPFSMPLKNIFGLAHFALIAASFWFAGILMEESLFAFFGLAAWVMLMSFERTGFKEQVEKIEES